jgi:four helix bundle protein
VRVKICRKEAKESIYWLKLVQLKSDLDERNRKLLIDEATQLMKIFNAIIEKSKRA